MCKLRWPLEEAAAVVRRREEVRLAPAQLLLLHRPVEDTGECAQEVLAEEDAGPEAARVGVLCVEGVIDTARRLVGELAERVAEEQRHDPLAVGLWDVEPDCCGRPTIEVAARL